MINIYDFFEFDENGIAVQKPINRIAYTKEDIDYKLKYIKAMQELGMEVTIDKAGNICGTIPEKFVPIKVLFCFPIPILLTTVVNLTVPWVCFLV